MKKKTSRALGRQPERDRRPTAAINEPIAATVPRQHTGMALTCNYWKQYRRDTGQLGWGATP
jgi:hypothetical protein